MKIIGFAGLSESGKSYCGKYLEEQHQIPRVKIVRFIEQCRKEYMNNAISLDEFHDFLYHPTNKFTDFFMDEIISRMKQMYNDHDTIVIESLRNPYLGKYFHEKLRHDFTIVYMDTALDVRVNRESKKINRSFEETFRATYEKDQLKIAQGALEYKEMSDIIYDNNGSSIKLDLFLDELVSQ